MLHFLVQFPENSILKILFILLRWSFSYLKLRVFIWFRLNPRNFNPRNFRFLVSFSFETIFPLSRSATTFHTERCEIFRRIFWSIWKVYSMMPTHSNAHAKVQNWIWTQFPGNEFEFGPVWNDFCSSTIWAIQIQVSFARIKNPKNPGIQPNHVQFRDINKLEVPLVPAHLNMAIQTVGRVMQYDVSQSMKRPPVKLDKCASKWNRVMKTFGLSVSLVTCMAKYRIDIKMFTNITWWSYGLLRNRPLGA